MATQYPIKKIDRIKIAERLRNARAKAGLTQHQVSVRANIPVSAICAIEHHRRSLGLDVCWRMCQALGLSMDEVIGG